MYELKVIYFAGLIIGIMIATAEAESAAILKEHPAIKFWKIFGCSFIWPMVIVWECSRGILNYLRENKI